MQWLRPPAETACVHGDRVIIHHSVRSRTVLADGYGQKLCCTCDGKLTTKLDMRAAKCRVAQPCSVTLAPHSTAAQKKATMPGGQHNAQAATRLRTAVPNGGPSCNTEPAICTNAVSGRKQTCVAAEGAGHQLTGRFGAACIRERAVSCGCKCVKGLRGSPGSIVQLS